MAKAKRRYPFVCGLGGSSDRSEYSFIIRFNKNKSDKQQQQGKGRTRAATRATEEQADS
jgi:hypothetical protein